MLHRASSWLGHDDLGRSLLFRLVPGFLISLAIGLVSAAVAGAIGVGLGMIAGLSGGKLDALLMRLVDVLYGLPYLLTMIVLQIAFLPSLQFLFGQDSQTANVVLLFLAIGGVNWLTMARVIRGQVLSLRGQPFIEAARVAGADRIYIGVRHLLPNLSGTILVYTALVIPQAILQESLLSYLGIGVQPPMPSLGRLTADGVQAVNLFVDFWWLLVFPCTALVLVLLGLSFIGDALRDALDPRVRVRLLD